MLGPNDPLNPDIRDPDADLPATPPADDPEDDFEQGDNPDAVPSEPADEAPE